jgi:hypothetical protein
MTENLAGLPSGMFFSSSKSMPYLEIAQLPILTLLVILFKLNFYYLESFEQNLIIDIISKKKTFVILTFDYFFIETLMVNFFLFI